MTGTGPRPGAVPRDGQRNGTRGLRRTGATGRTCGSPVRRVAGHADTVPDALPVGVGEVRAVPDGPRNDRLARNPRNQTASPRRSRLDGIGPGTGTVRRLATVPPGPGAHVGDRAAGEEAGAPGAGRPARGRGARRRRVHAAGGVPRRPAAGGPGHPRPDRSAPVRLPRPGRTGSGPARQAPDGGTGRRPARGRRPAAHAGTRPCLRPRGDRRQGGRDGRAYGDLEVRVDEQG
ncbi:hypothetical protein GCM10010266_42560 [Streptomyces griseomycini]|nr:hypothetical protein GCM10010266_42560 [Streptomyces griseomycini]